MNETERMKELVKKLNEAAKAYYQEDREIMSNLEYDTLYDELQVLEEKTGVTLAGSPTTKVGYEAMDELPKEAHESPMLSLDKTKDVEVLRSFIGDHKTLLSWKMDGLTVVLTYRGGTLAKAVTRGNGVIGEVVTNNAKVFENIPLKIPYQGELVLRGEAIIRYSDFEKINEEIEDVDAKYKNPRNLCSGSVRQLNNEITAKRHVHFMAFALVSAPEQDFENSRIRQMEWLKEQGFEVVEYKAVTKDNLDEAMQYFSRKSKQTISRPMALSRCMTISPTENHLAQPRNSRGTLSPSNGRMNRRRPRCLKLSGARREPVSSIRLRFLSRSSWKELRFPAQASTTSVSCVRWISVWVIKSLSTKQT